VRRARRPLVAAVGSLALFVALAASAGDGALRWDGAVRDAVAAVAPVASSDVHVDPFMAGLTFVVGAMTLVFGAWLVVRRSYRAALYLAGGIVGSVAISTLVKGVVARPPIEGPADEFSFPSGTTTWSAATAMALVLLVGSQRVRTILMLAGAALVLGLGAVIVWEEWHYPSDVLAGWSLGVGCALAVWLGLGRPVVDTASETVRYSRARREERPAAAPSAPRATTSGGTDTAA
jgi:membrane-associated phospholipid phosphatase